MTASASARAALTFALLLAAASAPYGSGARLLDFAAASIVVPAGAGRGAERLAADVLREEIAKRTGLRWPVVTEWPSQGAAIGIAMAATSAWEDVPAVRGHAEGFRLTTGARDGRPSIRIAGNDARGLLFGVGRLLREVRWGPGAAAVPDGLDAATAPRYGIRGHQLGYRAHSNTYDGWGEAQYDQYVRELVLLGANAIENIPFQDSRVSPLMPLPRDAMTRRVSAICAKYGVDYWLWTPADFDLRDQAARAAALERFEALFADLPRLDAIFVPGGDPGDNPASVVLPYLRDIAMRLNARHPAARVWLSLQHFDRVEVDHVFDWIHREQPSWLGGLVAGPASYPLAEIRHRLDPTYRVRDYPDVTHTVRSQYPVPWWDPAFALTLGREPVNPRPAFYAKVHDAVARPTDGFISYSDGVNDDVNKAVWTMKAWDPGADVRGMLEQYARLFFGAAVAPRAAEGLLALERNWEGPLDDNTGVDETLALWRDLDTAAPHLADDWRWQMHLMRAYYDAYTRHRLLYEARLEDEALDALATAPRVGSGTAMDRALAILARAERENCCPEWRRRIEDLCDALFRGIRMQTSMAKHSASGAERGAVLDFVDHPLNNRWWLEDQFAEVRRLTGEPARLRRLAALAAWSRPGVGSFYDDVGDVGNSPRVVRGRPPLDDETPTGDAIPHFTWEGGPSRTRLSWLTSLRWPKAIEYPGLDPRASYVVKLNVIRPAAPGQVRLRIDGEPATATRLARARGDLVEFAVPPALVRDGRITLTFDEVDESHVNWRQYSRLVEAWLIREP
jgi:hypothetical protein